MCYSFNPYSYATMTCEQLYQLFDYFSRREEELIYFLNDENARALYFQMRKLRKLTENILRKMYLADPLDIGIFPKACFPKFD